MPLEDINTFPHTSSSPFHVMIFCNRQPCIYFYFFYAWHMQCAICRVFVRESINTAEILWRFLLDSWWKKKRRSNKLLYILQTIKCCLQNCILKHVIEGKIEERTEVKETRGRRRKHLLNDFKEKRRYCKLKKNKQVLSTIVLMLDVITS
jgi:hypothetical protein